MTDERHSDPARRDERIREAIRSSGDVRADAAFRKRLKCEFTRGTFAEPAVASAEVRVDRAPRWAWLLVPAAAVILVVALLLPKAGPSWAVPAVRGEGQVEIDGHTLSTDDPRRIARALSSGGIIQLPGGVSLDLRLEDLLILELDGGSDATLPAPPGRDTDGPLLSEVRNGELRIKTGPGFPGTELHILTTEGRIEIVGTILSVYKGDDFTCVCVLEGTARVGVDEGDLEEIPPGMLKIMFEGGDSRVLEISLGHEEDLLEFMDRFEDFFEAPE